MILTTERLRLREMALIATAQGIALEDIAFVPVKTLSQLSLEVYIFLPGMVCTIRPDVGRRPSSPLMAVLWSFGTSMERSHHAQTVFQSRGPHDAPSARICWDCYGAASCKEWQSHVP